MPSDLDQICLVLDKLTLDALTLMEEEVHAKLSIENAMCDGETRLAKSRYILGHNSVSSIQLPTENSQDFEATTVVESVEDEDSLGQPTRELKVVKKENQVDPVRWFGYLVPQDMYKAQNLFKQALQWVVRASNVQAQLVETCNKIEQLKHLKTSLITNIH